MHKWRVQQGASGMEKLQVGDTENFLSVGQGLFDKQAKVRWIAQESHKAVCWAPSFTPCVHGILHSYNRPTLSSNVHVTLQQWSLSTSPMSLSNRRKCEGWVWWKDSNLTVKVQKNWKEHTTDFLEKKKDVDTPPYMNGNAVGRVASFKFPGTFIT